MNAPTSATRRRMLAATILGMTLITGYSLAEPQLAVPRHAAQRHRPDPYRVQVSAPGSRFGSPLTGLTADQITAFAAGLDEFQNKETAAGGLGPIFNNSSCAACHSKPAIGGSSNIVVTRFGHETNGQFDPLANIGGSLLQDKAIAPGALEVIPSQANVVAHRQSTALFGLGLIEAIPDETILQNAARSQHDGLHGLPSMVADETTGATRVGRFGWKGQHATLLAFAGDAYLNEMGITNRFFPTENAPNGDQVRLAHYDKVTDPEDTVDPQTGRSDLDAVADFMRLLAPPPTRQPSAAAQMGGILFTSVGCSGCHTPRMQTGPNAVAALDRKGVNLYSDLLLHDMGSLGDGIVQGMALGSDIKTPPLWGVRTSAPYLHDGRVATLDAAIRAHDGEARRARDRYLHLQEVQRQQVLAFLDSI